MILAAIDIGSNAARLLITEVLERDKKADFDKLTLLRVPLRLGFDVFERREISPEKVEMFLNCMRSFRYLMETYGVEHCKAAATSAMRDAGNSSDILLRTKQETGINVEVISGDDEASYIYENHIAENLDKNNIYLYIDVGGGSTELTCFADGRLLFKKSFNIGTIRLLKGQVTDQIWETMKDFLKKELKGQGKKSHRHRFRRQH